MTYYKIKGNTQAFELVTKVFDTQRKWYTQEISEKLERFLEMPSYNLYVPAYKLSLSKPIPGRESEFLKPKNGIYRPKKNSSLHKEWDDFQKENNLEWYTFSQMMVELNVPFDIHYDVPAPYGVRKSSWQIVKLYGVFVLECIGKNLEKTFDWLEPISKADYYELQAKWERERERKVI